MSDLLISPCRIDTPDQMLVDDAGHVGHVGHVGVGERTRIDAA